MLKIFLNDYLKFILGKLRKLCVFNIQCNVLNNIIDYNMLLLNMHILLLGLQCVLHCNCNDTRNFLTSKKEKIKAVTAVTLVIISFLI